jgi:gp16 family phage-associated protein
LLTRSSFEDYDVHSFEFNNGRIDQMGKKYEPTADWQARASAFRADLVKKGMTVSDFARRNDLSYTSCVHALNGNTACTRGEGHRAAVLMGLKDSTSAGVSNSTDSHGQTKKLLSRLRETIGDEPVCAFARRSGVSEADLWSYLNDGHTPSLEKASAIARAGGVRLEWLATGDGRKALTEDTSTGGLK